MVGNMTEECESHVREGENIEQDPKYRGAREIPWEDRGTTL